MITLSTGIEVSQQVLKFLKKDKKLKNYSIYIGAFTNCREVGYTYSCHYKKKGGETIGNKNLITFCTYEHRNSDEIIINGKKGYVNLNGDLPYMGETKHTYYSSFPFEEYEQCANELSRLIITTFKETN